MPGRHKGEAPAEPERGNRSAVIKTLDEKGAGGLTIVGFVRSRKMNIYTGRERVRGASQAAAGE